MKNILMAAALVTGLAFTAETQAQQTVPVYVSQTASGTTTSTVCFAASPLQQIRIVSVVATSDLAGSTLKFKTGTTPATVAYTNVIGSDWLGVSATNGFFALDYIVVQKVDENCTNAQIKSFLVATNIITQNHTVATVPGDQIYRLGTVSTMPVGSNTVSYQGEALYVGNRGRPVLVQLDGTSANTFVITARYE